MSPRRRRRTPVHRHRPRREVLLAVGAAVAVVASAALFVWLLRPGSPAPLTGGAANRQPRVAWLVVISLVVAGLAIWWVVRRYRRRGWRVMVAIGLLVLLAVAMLASFAGVLWPGGLLRHTPEVPALPPVTVPPPQSLPEDLTTTTPGASAPTSAPSATTAPAPDTGAAPTSAP